MSNAITTRKNETMNQATNAIFLTRAEYDQTIVGSPQDIRNAYDKCCTTWIIGGVRIEGEGKHVAKIHCHRCLINAYHEYV